MERAKEFSFLIRQWVAAVQAASEADGNLCDSLQRTLSTRSIAYEKRILSFTLNKL
jgi:hypothetical protein